MTLLREDKLVAVQRYLEGKESYHSIGEPIRAFESVVMNSVAQYNYHGIEGLFKTSYYFIVRRLNDLHVITKKTPLFRALDILINY